MSKKDHGSVLCFSCEELQRKYAGCRLGVRLQCSISVRAVQRLQRDTWARLWSTNVCLWKQMVGEMSPGGHWDRSKKEEQGRRWAGLEKEVKKIKFKCLWAITTPENREQLGWRYLFYWLTFTVKPYKMKQVSFL